MPSAHVRALDTSVGKLSVDYISILCVVVDRYLIDVEPSVLSFCLRFGGLDVRHNTVRSNLVSSEIWHLITYRM